MADQDQSKCRLCSFSHGSNTSSPFPEYGRDRYSFHNRGPQEQWLFECQSGQPYRKVLCVHVSACFFEPEHQRIHSVSNRIARFNEKYCNVFDHLHLGNRNLDRRGSPQPKGRYHRQLEGGVPYTGRHLQYKRW